MALESDYSHQVPGARVRRLVVVPGGKATVYTSDARARIVFKRMVIGAFLLTVAVTSWVMGFELLRWLCVGFILLFVIALVAVVGWLVVDTLKSLR